MFLLSGVARYLFVPLAEAVVFAMLMSYILSRTLIPTLCKYWLRTHEQEQAAARPAQCVAALPARLRGRGSNRSATVTQSVLDTILHHRAFS